MLMYLLLRNSSWTIKCDVGWFKIQGVPKIIYTKKKSARLNSQLKVTILSGTFQ